MRTLDKHREEEVKELSWIQMTLELKIEELMEQNEKLLQEKKVDAVIEKDSEKIDFEAGMGDISFVWEVCKGLGVWKAEISNLMLSLSSPERKTWRNSVSGVEAERIELFSKIKQAVPVKKR